MRHLVHATILTTAYSESLTGGFELEVTDYLMNPVPFRASSKPYSACGRL